MSMSPKLAITVAPSTPSASPFILHPQATYALDELEFIFDHLMHTGEALGQRLTGPTNAGKTAVVKELLRRHPSTRTAAGVKRPVLYVHLVERARLDEVYIDVLKALGDPAPLAGTEKDRKQRVRTMLVAAEVKMMIFDEPHHLTEARSDGARVGLTQFGKAMIDSGVCVVFAGVKSVDDLVAQSDELARRFRGKLSLGPYTLSNSNDIKFLRDFCNAVGQQLRDVEPVAFGSDNIWFSRLLAASAGLVGAIVQLVSQGQSRARRAGDKTLTLKHMSDAWTYFAKSEENNLQHLKSKGSSRLTDVFRADDTTVAAIVGELAKGKP
jgi:hypothetical protein